MILVWFDDASSRTTKKWGQSYVENHKMYENWGRKCQVTETKLDTWDQYMIRIWPSINFIARNLDPGS